MLELGPRRTPFEIASSILSDSENWPHVLQIIQESNFTNKQLLDLLRISDGNWIFAEYLVEKGVFNSEEMLDIIKICNGYWRIATSIIWTDKLNLSEMIESYALCRCDSDLWPNIAKRANFSELETTELMRLMEIGKFGFELVETIIKTNKFEENEMWSIFKKTGCNPRIANILMKINKFNDEHLAKIQEVINAEKARSDELLREFYAKHPSQ